MNWLFAAMPPEPFLLHLAGNWPRSQVRIAYQPIEYVLPDEFARRAVVFWEQLIAEGRRRIFNGALCRLENFSERNGALHLSFSRTCYRDLLFSNAHTNELIGAFGEVGPARALGISVALETADGYLLLIRRSEHVGEGPGALDVIGGHVHPDDHFHDGAPEVFLAIKDEIRTELGIPMDLLGEPICSGLTEDRRHRKPELNFFAPLPLTMQEVRQLARQAIEAGEYTELLAVKADTAILQRFIAEHETHLTSSALGCLHLYARMKTLSRV
jgi:hypothetical protein